jgi:diguanylate cyclase (GGDEF)-like protein
MDGGNDFPAARLNLADLSRLMPMYLWVAHSGHIRAAGPTLAKLLGDRDLEGARFLECFAVARPHPVDTMADFAALAGQRLHLKLHAPPQTIFRAIAVPLGGDQGMIVNLSFGIAAANAVRDHGLSSADFAATDLTVELLYLTEVKAAIMDELAAMNARLQAARATAETQATTDALTGLANRRAFDQALGQAILGAGAGRDFALAHLDLDFFKAVNDSHGHAAGDLILTHVADVLRTELRGRDFAARVGGDEFILILRGPTNIETIHRTGARIIRQIEQPVLHEGRECRVSASIGVVLSSTYAKPEAEQMLSDADAALYASKRAGRGQCTVVPGQIRAPDKATADQNANDDTA